jgi:PAS domain S-box-containing protein
MKDSLHILNLEDNVNDAELTRAMLSARWPACDLRRVDSRADFIAALDQGGIDVILSDFTMPGFNGLEALGLARKLRPDIPFLFVSGTIGEDTAIEALKHGATDYVLKHRLLRLIPALDRALREAGERAECQRAEETMRQSEHKYRQLFECLGDAAFLAVEQTGKIIDANRRAETMLGCAPEEILGHKETRFLLLDRKAAPAAASGPETPATTATECGLVRANGQTIRVALRSTRLTLYGTPLVLRIAHDLGDRAALDRIEEARDRMEAIIRSSDDAIIGKTLEGTITNWNSGAQKIFGYTEQEAVGKPLWMLIPPDRRPEEADILARIARGERVEHFETVRVRKDGRLILVSVTISPIRDAGGNIIGASKIVRDITERKQTGDQLTASLKEIGDLKAALDEHAIVAITDPQGRITSVNDKFCAISKYSRAELLGQDHRLINSGFHPKEFMRELWVTIAQGRVWKGELKNRAKDGSYYWVDTTIVPFLNAAGKPRQYVAIRTDITECKLAEEKVHQLNTELERRVAERTAQLRAANQELEAFSYSVSHDLRAPLRHLAGFVELLRQEAGPALPENSRRYMETISKSAERMGNMIDDLLAFSRLGRTPLQKTDVDLNPLVQEALADIKSETKERQIVWNIQPLPAVRADRALLRLALVNLLSNAVKFTGGRAEARIEIGSVAAAGNETVIFVRDNGAGFDPRYAGKLFGVFQRLHSDREFPGTGIGLANVQRIIQRHGGRTWAEGAVDAGATFCFSLPKPDGDSEAH